MKPTTYHIVLSDGSKTDIEKQNAGEAIETALRKNIGLKVVECFSGEKAKAWINHDIPPHVAHLTNPTSRPTSPTVCTVEMFDQGEIERESRAARLRN